MEYIAHRINTIEDLNKLPLEYGVEIDLRDDLTGRIYIQHNPYEDGESFEDYLAAYHHGTMICNVKSERIEYKVRELLENRGISNFFFLDSSFPMIMQLAREGEKRVAIRYSEYEGIDTIRKMSGKVEWIWVDCFEQFPLSRSCYDEMKNMGYKLCLVSPELQGRPQDIQAYKKICKEQGIVFDAICTKQYNFAEWRDM